MEVREIFEARPASVTEVLTNTGQCFYIPAYQRPYTWDDTNIKNLIEDIVNGQRSLINHKDAITFIGTVIFVNDQKKTTIEPQVKYQTPSKVCLIIDGQQRLTTLILFFTVLHRMVRSRMNNRIKHPTNNKNSWILQECNKVLNLLERSFIDEQSNGDGIQKYYPKIIRSYDDQWAHSEDQAKYISAVPFYIRSYTAVIKTDRMEVTEFKFSDLIKEKGETYHLVDSNAKLLEKLTKSLIKEGVSNNFEGDHDLPTYKEIKSSKEIQKSLFGDEFPVELMSEDLEIKEIELIKLLTFIHFILKRVSLTEVTAKNDEYAFDMFESLNTTGEPLTPFETFKPKIISAETHANFEKSLSKKYTDKIEEYLKKFKSADQRQKATSAIIIPFALQATGQKIAKKFSDQRKFLSITYSERCPTIEHKRTFVKELSELTEFYFEVWEGDHVSFFESKKIKFQNKDLSYLLIKVLKDSNHSILVPLLSKFSARCFKTNNEVEVKEFEEVIKIVTGFFVLWRGANINTAGIDKIHRELFQDSHKINNLASSNETITLDKVKSFYKTKLDEKKYLEIHEWVGKTHLNAVYKQSKPLTKLMLLLSHEDFEILDAQKATLKRGRIGSCSLLTESTYEFLGTIEHIAPQSKTSDYNEKIYRDERTIHTIGNLTLLPLKENSSINNLSFDKKKKLFNIISSDSLSSLDDLCNNATDFGINSDSFILRDSKIRQQIKIVKPLTSDVLEWSLDTIQNRSKNLSELIHLYISKWFTS